MAEFVPVMAASKGTSSYRVKFHREEFLQLIEIAKPQIIYKRSKNFFFAFDGFVIYSQECQETDFQQKIIEAVEFSNEQWQT